MRYIKKAGFWRVSGRLPVLRARRRWTDVTNDFAKLRLFLIIVDQTSGFEIDVFAGGNMDKRRRGSDFAGGAVDHIDITVSFRTNENLSSLSFYIEIQQQIFVDAIVVMKIVRRELVSPDRLAAVGLARENRGGPLIVTRTLLVIPRSGIASAVVNEIELGIVGDPTPDRAATDLPGIGRPARNPEIFSLIHFVKRLELRPDQNVLVRSCAVGAPNDFAMP